jgi:hypothetical protein
MEYFKRQLFFILLTISLGSVLIAIILFLDFIENIDIQNSTNSFSNVRILEDKIKNLSSAEYDPFKYACLDAEIYSSNRIGLVSQSAEDNLILQLKNRQLDNVIEHCDNYLLGQSHNYSSEKLLYWLYDLNQVYPENKKIEHFRAQINAYNNYKFNLRQDVLNFVNDGSSCLDKKIYNNLKERSTNMKGLDKKYKTTKIIKNLKESNDNLLSRKYSDSNEFCPE